MKQQATIQITGMTCANCSSFIEKRLNKTEGILSATVNLATEKATIEFDTDRISLQQIHEFISKIGYGTICLLYTSRCV